MRIQSLKHVVDAVAALARPTDITVLGSSALLALDARLGEHDGPLELSLDADLLVEPCDDESAKVLDEALGAGSMFHRKFGVYADLMRPDIKDTLPRGWRARRLRLEGSPRVRCLDPYDVAVVKLVMGRKKDMDLLAALLRRGTLKIRKLRTRYAGTTMGKAEMFKAGLNLRKLTTSARA